MRDEIGAKGDFLEALSNRRCFAGGALRRLMAGSALTLLLLGTAAPALAQEADEEERESEEEQTIIVTGSGSQVLLTEEYSGGQVARGARAGLLGNLDMMEAPFASTAFTDTLMRDQQAESVGDVLQNEPGVQVARGFGNFQQVYVVRGFPVFSDDMTYNGVYGILPRQYVASELLERVEIFRGANAFLNGAAPGGSGVGGAVNLVPKRAPSDPLFRATFGGGNRAQGYAAFDLGRRFGDQRRFGVRVNAATRAGETAVEDQERTMFVVGVGTDYRGTNFRFSADLGYQYRRIDAPRPSVTPLEAAPEPPEASSNFAQRWTFSGEKQLFGAVRGEFDLADSVTVWAAVGGRQGKEENVLANPRATAAGTTTATRFDNNREDTILSADAGVRLEFETGFIKHRVIASASLLDYESKNAFASYRTPTLSNLYNPVDNPPPPGGDVFLGGLLDDPLVTGETVNRSAAVANVMQAFDEMITAIVGIRYQEIENAAFNYNTGAETSRIKGDAYTPSFGLVVRPTEAVSVYANYSESLVPGAVAPATAGGRPVLNAGEVFPPFRGKQYEAGVKVDLGTFGGSISAFSLTLPSAFVIEDVFTVAGKQRNRGLELNFFGEPIEGLRLLGGATYVDSELSRTAIPANDGNTAVGVPKWQTSLSVDWDVPGTALTLDGQVTHSSSQFINAANSFEIPSWVVFDLGARYTAEVGEGTLTLRARLENVLDKDYWASAGGFPGANYLVLGEPRTLIFSAAVEF